MIVAAKKAGDAVVSCQPQNVTHPKIQLMKRWWLLGASSAAHRYWPADVGDLRSGQPILLVKAAWSTQMYIEAYSASEMHVANVPMKQKMKP